MFFDLGREVVVEYLREVFGEEVIDHDAGVCGDEFAPVAAYRFGLGGVCHLAVAECDDCECLPFSLAVALDDVFALLYGRDGRCVGRWAADAQFFEFFDEAGFGVARRLLCVAFGGGDFAAGEPLSHGHGRQCAAVVLCLGVVVVRLAVEAQESVEPDDFARGGERVVCAVDGYPDVGLVDECVGHLRGERALADEVIEAFLLLCAVDGVVLHVGGAYGFVCLLCALGVCGVAACLDVFVAHEACDLVACGGKGQCREIDRVGTHVGDVSRLIEPLGDHHRLRDREAELACRFLLECRCGERRCGRAAHGVCLDARDGERGVAACAEQCLGGGLVGDASCELGGECVRGAVGGCHGEVARHAEPLLRDEGVDFPLAVYDEPHCHRLHASCRQCGLDFAPEHGRQLEAHDAVEHAACLLCIDEVDIDVARCLDGVQDGALCDFVEDDAARACRVEPEDLCQMPRDGFSLAVFIGCEPHGLGLGCFALELGDELALVGGHFIVGREAVCDVYAEVFLFQVSDVSIARHYFVILAEEFLDGLGLGG